MTRTALAGTVALAENPSGTVGGLEILVSNAGGMLLGRAERAPVTSGWA